MSLGSNAASHFPNWGRPLMIQIQRTCHVNDALHKIDQAEYGVHYMVI
jgi:hypothetical protein